VPRAIAVLEEHDEIGIASRHHISLDERTEQPSRIHLVLPVAQQARCGAQTPKDPVWIKRDDRDRIEDRSRVLDRLS
jgi:hypothetical protein